MIDASLGWAILCSLVAMVFAAGGGWYEARRTRKDVDKILEAITPIPELAVEVKTLGREMGERKAWEQRHTELHLQQGD